MENTIIYSKNVLEFVTIAAEYCSFVESAEVLTKVDFLNKSHKLLSLLYLKSTLIPTIVNISDESNEKFVTELDWQFIQSKVQKKLGKHEMFLDVYQAVMALETDAENVSLSEVFADIHQDLMDFISLYRVGNEENMNDALWECQQNFQQYWGTRLLAALSAIHRILYSGDDLSHEEPEELISTNNTDDRIFSQRQKSWSDNPFEE